MKFTTLVLALAFGASSAFVAPIAHRSLAPRAPTLAARSRPDFRRDTVKVQLAVPALPPAFSPGPEVVGGTTAAAFVLLRKVARKAYAQKTPAGAVGKKDEPAVDLPQSPQYDAAMGRPWGLTPSCKRMYVHWSYIMCLATSMVNAATLIQFDEVVMHMTGPSTKGPLFLASGLAARGWHNLGTIGAFLGGCFFAGVATSDKDANTPVKDTAPWLMLAGIMLAAAGDLAAHNMHYCLYIAAAAGGILNGLTSKMTTFRVSHVTGTVTDMGLLLGKSIIMKLDKASALKLRDLTVLMSAWLVGGAASFYLSTMMTVGKVISYASIPVMLLGLKGIVKPYAKGPLKL